MNNPIQRIGSSPFPTTQWTLLIEVIQKGGDSAAFGALGELFARYRPTIDNFFMRRGYSESEAADYTQAFFSSKIVEPWNRRHGHVAVSYDQGDIKKIPVLVTKLNRRQRPVAQFLWESLSEPTQQAFKDYTGKDQQADTLRTGLAKDLNILIQGPCIYDEKRFTDVELSVESRNLLERKTEGEQKAWLNRSLLSDAFPGHFVRGIGFLYLVERMEQRKFRTFLSHALWCFLKDQTKEGQAQRAGGKVAHTSLDELEDLGHEIGFKDDAKFGRDFDLAFAAQLISLAANRSKHSKQLEAHFRGEISQKQAAEELGISENAFKAAYKRFRETLANDLWAEVSKTVGPDKNEVKAEIQYLLSLLAI